MWLILLLSLLSLLLLGGVWRLALVVRSMTACRLADRMAGVRSDAPDQLGISLLVVDGVDLRQLSRLLAVEYARYEVVVAADMAQVGDRFTELVATYRLIRVEYRPTGDLPVAGVRGLYRSRKRRFRRLVLLDLVGARIERLNGAADVAAYDYLLPVNRRAVLVQGVVERLIVLIGSAPQGCDLLRSTVGERTFLCAREAVVRAGGFAHYPAWRTGRLLHAPILVAADEAAARRRRYWPLVVLLPIVLVGVLAACHWWVAAAVGVTWLLLFVVAVRVGQLTRL